MKTDIEGLPKCRTCKRSIVFGDIKTDAGTHKIPFDPEPDGRGGFRPGPVRHTKTCPDAIKQRAQKLCPICSIRREGLAVLNARPRVIYGNFCALHKDVKEIAIDWFGNPRTLRVDYKELRKLRDEFKKKMQNAEKADVRMEEYGGGIAKWF